MEIPWLLGNTLVEKSLLKVYRNECKTSEYVNKSVGCFCVLGTSPGVIIFRTAVLIIQYNSTAALVMMLKYKSIYN